MTVRTAGHTPCADLARLSGHQIYSTHHPGDAGLDRWWVSAVGGWDIGGYSLSMVHLGHAADAPTEERAVATLAGRLGIPWPAMGI